MALMPCSECGRQVSTMAFTCPDCGAPVDAPPAAPAPERAPQPAASRGYGNQLLLAGALAALVLGGGADAMVRRWKSKPAGEALPAVGKPGRDAEADQRQFERGVRSRRDKFMAEMTEQMPGVGTAQRYATRAVDSLNQVHMDDRARKAEIAMRVTLADVAMQQEIDLAAYGGYTAKFSALGVKPRDGVSVEMTVEGQTWSATATHKDLPGMTCTTSASTAEREAGQVFCTKSGS